MSWQTSDTGPTGSGHPSRGLMGPWIHEQKNSKVSNGYIRYVKQTEILTHAAHVNGWEPAVYMCCMSQNFRLFHVSNLSARNFRLFLLMYPGSAVTRQLQGRVSLSSPTAPAIKRPSALDNTWLPQSGEVVASPNRGFADRIWCRCDLAKHL